MAKKRQKQNTDYSRFLSLEKKRLEEVTRLKAEDIKKKIDREDILHKLNQSIEEYCTEPGNVLLFFVFWCLDSLNFFIIPFCGPNEEKQGTFTKCFYKNVIFPIINERLPSCNTVFSSFPKDNIDICTEEELVQKLYSDSKEVPKEEMLQFLYMKYIRNGQMVIPTNISCITECYEDFYLKSRFDRFISTLTLGRIQKQVNVFYRISNLKMSYSTSPTYSYGVNECRHYATTERHDPHRRYDDDCDDNDIKKGAFINFTFYRSCNKCENTELYAFCLNLSTDSNGSVCIVYDTSNKRYEYNSLLSLFKKLNEDGTLFRPNNQPSCYICLDDEEIQKKVVALITHPHHNPFIGNYKHTFIPPPPKIPDDYERDVRKHCFQLDNDPRIATIIDNPRYNWFNRAFEKEIIGRVFNYPKSYCMIPPPKTTKFKTSFDRMVMTVMLCNSTESLPYLPSEMIEFILSFILVSDVSYDPISSSDYDLTTSNSPEVGRFLDALYA